MSTWKFVEDHSWSYWSITRNYTWYDLLYLDWIEYLPYMIRLAIFRGDIAAIYGTSVIISYTPRPYRPRRLGITPIDETPDDIPVIPTRPKVTLGPGTWTTPPPKIVRF